MDKRRLLAAAVELMEREVSALTATAEAARAAATHEEARPENDKDTRALEQSYLARGQALRAEEAAEALMRLRFMDLVSFGENDTVGVSALVTVAVDDDERTYFIVAAAGGLKLLHEGLEVQLLSSKSPLGAALLGRSVGDAFELSIAGKKREYEILAVA